MSITYIKENYILNDSRELKEDEVSDNPIKQFELWFSDALKADGKSAHAMSLATSTNDGKPSVRTVLLKGYDESGFIFFTNYSSRKGNELKENPRGALLFFWKELERQIRIEGIIEKVSQRESDEYFHKRPVDSQIAALASNQSSVIKNRDALENKFNELKNKYKNSVVPLPEFWGGYKLIPGYMEFWQGRQNRMHDRISYTNENGNWKIERLAP
jgi:pyridoxamine 5'-phosphate oxidase